MKKNLTVKELATEIVGDGKSPNKYFVTIAYGWYRPSGFDSEMVQVENSLDSVTVLFTNRADAERFFDAVPMFGASIDKVTGETIGQVFMEDRKTGVLKEKFIGQTRNNIFRVEQYF